MDPILDAPLRPERKFEYAAFGMRFVASLIDGLLVWVFSVVVFAAVNSGTHPRLYLIINFVSLLINILYYAGMESSDKQATLGKMALGIKVGDAHGDRISFLNAVGRYFAKFISALILLIGYIMAAFDEKGQALHDKLANTYVYSTRK